MRVFEVFVATLIRNQKNVQKIIDSIIEDNELRHNHILVLGILIQQKDGFSASDFCNIFNYDKALISRVTRQLANRGFICRNPKDEGLARGYKMIITEAGKEYMKADQKKLSKYIQMLMEGVTQEEQDVFLKTTEKFGRNLDKVRRYIESEKKEEKKNNA